MVRVRVSGGFTFSFVALLSFDSLFGWRKAVGDAEGTFVFKKWLVCILKFIITDDPSARVPLVDTTVFLVCQALLMRVVISKDEARRVQLSQVPETVDALIDVIKGKLQLQGEFSLQFEDNTFSKMQSVICQRFQSYPIVVQSYTSSGKTLNQTNITASLLVQFLPWTL